MQLLPLSLAVPTVARRWRSTLVAGAGVVTAAAAGWLAAAHSPLVAGGAVLAALLALWALRRPEVSLVTLVGVIALLPFGVAPLRLGLSPTLLDLLTLAIFLLWLALAAARRCSARLLPVGAAVIAFTVTLWGAAMLAQAPLRADETGRTFAKLVAAHLLFVPVLNLVPRPGDVRRLVAWLLLASGVEAAIGLFLYVMPRDLAFRALVALGPLGYPTDGSVWRYRPDSDLLRATGTSVDPNMLGALLMVAGAIAVPLLLAQRPAIPRRLVALSVLPLIPSLLLTESRSSWLGLAAGVLFVATLRYRKLWLVLALAVAAVLALPQASRFGAHLVSGLQAQDRASAMRLGELQNAVTVIAGHPWFGVGWGDGSQSIELTYTLGVSNIYLTVAERAGLPAMGVYLAVVLTLASTLWPVLRRRLRHPADDGLFLGLVAALLAIQVAGMLDHHFVRFPHLVSLFWLVAALAVAESRRAECGG